MEVNVDKSVPCEATIQFTVPSREFESQVNMLLKNLGGRVRMKGFRPGKVPAQVLKREYGTEARREASQHFIQQAYQEAVQTHELEPAAHPRIAEEDLDNKEGGDFSHTFVLFLKPKIELGEYTGLEVDSQEISADDDEVQAGLEDLRRRQSRPSPAGDEGLPEDGMALAKVELLFEDEVVDERDGLRLSPSVAMPGFDEAAYKEAMVGSKDGAVVELPYEFPEDFPKSELIGKTGLCRISLAQTFQIIPPTDEELWKMLSANDAEEMQVKLREEMLKAKREQENQRIETQLLEEVMAMHPLELPAGMVEEQAKGRMANLEQQMAEEGLSPEEAEQRLAAEAGNAHEASARSLKALYLVEAISKKEELEVTEEEMTREITSIAVRNGVPVDQVKEYYSKQNLFPQLAAELMEKKVRNFLRENASIRSVAG